MSEYRPMNTFNEVHYRVDATGVGYTHNKDDAKLYGT